MEFTGERYIPELDWPEVSYEHWHRYLLASQFVKNKVVIDIACGEGYGSYYLSNFAREVIGIDINRETVDYASKKYVKDNLKFVVGSASNIPIQKKTKVDVIVSFETIEHITENDQSAFLAEAKRLLKSSGIFMVSTPNKLIYSDIHNYKNEFHLKEFYLSEFRELLSTQFENVDLLGQKIEIGSYISSLDNKTRNLSEYHLNFGQTGFQPTSEPRETPYMIAICSDASLPPTGASFAIDLSMRMLNKKAEEGFNYFNKRMLEIEQSARELTSQVAEKEQILQALSIQLAKKDRDLAEKDRDLAEKDRDLAEKDRALAEKDRNLTEITNSRAWRLALLFRRLRLIVVPPNSLRARILRQVWSIFILPFVRFNQNNKVKKTNPQKTRTFKRAVIEKSMHIVYFLNQRLPLSESSRQKLQQFVYKLLPAFFHRYKRTVNEMMNEGYPQPKIRGNNGQGPSVESFRLRESRSGLALWSLLLRVNESTLKSLLVPPPWQVEDLKDPLGTKERSEQTIEISPSQKLFNIVLFVNNPPAHFLNHCIRSVQEQTYKNWRLEIYVGADGLWNADALALQFEAEPRIHIQGRKDQAGVFETLKASVQESTGEYVILLNSYDELKPEALHHAANATATSQSDLLYCINDLSASIAYQDFDSLASWAANLFKEEIAFTQFIVWKKTYLETLFPDHFKSLIEDLIFIRNKLTGTHKPQQVKTLEVSCYSFREIPGRQGITLAVQDGKLDLVTASIPLRVLVDARLIGRQITGTERYIWELLKELSLLRQEYNLELKAIASSKLEDQITGVEFIPAQHVEAIRNAHIFHKTFPASEGRTLAEMALAHTVIFTPLDLILYTNPDYFLNEITYYNYRKTMQLAVRLADQIISISNHGKLEIETLLNIPGDRISPVYLGVHPEHFSREKQESKDQLALLKVPANYFLYIGTDYPHKNLVALLRAFNLVIQQIPAAQLVLVGAKYYSHPQPELDALLAQLSGHILHLGHVPDEILPSLYHHSCALVYPSLHEGFGLPLLEAMLCGTPVIASDATSIPEVSGQEAALLVDGRDEQQISEAMIRMWENPEARNRLVTAGYENAAKFSWKITARHTIESYQDAIHKALHTPPIKRINEKLNILSELQAPPPTILIVTHIRFYPPAAGNEQRLLRLVKFLKKLGYQIVMLVNPFLEATQLDRESRKAMHQYVDYYEEMGDVSIDEVHSLSLDSAIGNEPILDKWKLTEERFCPDVVLQRASSLIEQFSPKVILAEYIWTSRILALASPNTLKVIDTIDMFSRKKESVVKFGIQDTLAITPSEELAFINRSDVTIAIQDSEADAFRKLAPSCKIITAGIDFDVDQMLENTKTNLQAPTLLIVGSGNQINVHCITEFLDEVWPKIHQQVPSCRLRIVGKVGNSLTTKDPTVELIPYVRDLDATYRDATIVVNPVYAGTGIKVKSIEALGHGKAFVCWPEGAAGISSGSLDPFLIIHSWEELTQSVVDLLNYPEKRQNLEKAAQEFAKSTLSDKVIYRQVADCFDTFCKRKLNVLCLFLRYGINDHPQGLPDLQNWYDKKMSGTNVTTWIIDNKLEGEGGGIDLVTGFRLLSGNNEQREFSAFQKVLSQHREEIEAYDVVHFVTSAFNTLFTEYLDYFFVDQLEWVAHRPICLGHIDSYDEPIQIAGETSQSWIRTCFFFMSPETAYSIPNIVSFQEEEQFFDASGEFLNESSLSENYRQYIAEWLTGKTIQGVSWHSKIPDTRSFKGKTLAILNEHMLGIRLRKAGISLVDYFWLKENSQALYSMIDQPIPDSLKQVKFRQMHLFGRVHRDPIAT